MATEFAIKKSDGLFVGKDTELEFTTTEDFSSYAMEWNLYRLPLKQGDSALVTKTTGGGGITATADTVTVSVADTDTDGFPGSDSPNYYHELHRTDAGSEQVLSYGTVVLRQSLST